MMLPSIVEGGMTLRRLAFDPILIPLSASVAIGITFCVNVLAFVVFAAIQRIEPRIEWLLVLPLLVELYVFTIALGLLLSALYVRFRDISQVWELAAQLLFFACAIFYPVGILPDWAQKVAFLNPFVQIMQDIRHVLLGGSSGPYDVSADTVYAGDGGRLIPIAIVGAHSSSLRLPSSGVKAATSRRGSECRRDRGRRGLEDLPHPARAADVPQGVLPAPVPANDVRAQRGAEGRHLLGRVGRVLRRHRPERQRQEHAAPDPGRHLRARLRDASR